VIASSDSDFAPLVHRLREKGCVVRGIGQHGKTGDETQDVYDDFTVLEHRKAASGASSATNTASADKPARKTAARKTAASKTAASKTAVAKKAPGARKAALKTPVAKLAPAKTAAAPASRKATPRTAAAPEVGRVKPSPAPPAPAGRSVARGSSSQPRGDLPSVLACLPELAAGHRLALNVAVQRLREAQLLGKNSSSLKLFAQLSDQFELLPADKPTQVRLRR